MRLFKALEGKTITSILGDKIDGIAITFEDGSEFDIEPTVWWDDSESDYDERSKPVLQMSGEVKTTIKYGEE